MKKLLIIAIAIASLSSCSKDDEFKPTASTTPHPSYIIYPTFYLTLDFLDVHFSGKVQDAIVRHQEGNYTASFIENNEAHTFKISFDLDGRGMVQAVTGIYNGHSFILWNGGINICGGAQGVQINYTIYK